MLQQTKFADQSAVASSHCTQYLHSLVYNNDVIHRVELGNIWPPRGILAFSPFRVPLLNTDVLLSL